MSTAYKFKTKAYTLNGLITEVKSIYPKADVQDLIYYLSPRAGVYSVKFEAIDTYLGGHLNDVINGYTHVAGNSARTRLLNALKWRKQYGYFVA